MGHLGTVATLAYGGTGVSSRTITISLAVPKGGTVLGTMVWESSDNTVPTIASIVDTRGNTWVIDEQVAGGSTVAVALLRGRVSNALEVGDTITITTTGGTRTRWVGQFDGFDDVLQALNTTPLDVHTNQPAAASTSMPTGTTGVTFQDKMLVYAGHGLGVGRTFTPPGGWTERTVVETTVGSADRAVKCLFKYATLIGTQGGTTTISPSSTNAGVIGTYRVATGRNNYARTEHRFEGMPDGTTLTTSNAGDAAGVNYNLVNQTPVADDALVAKGTRSLLCALSSASACSGRDTTTVGATRIIRGRGYFYFTATPAANCLFVQILRSGAFAGAVQLTTANQLRLTDSAFAQMALSGTTVPLNQWVRIEWRFVASATVGQASVKMWSSIDSTGTPDIDLSSAASFNTLSYFDAYDTGSIFSSSRTYTLSYDDVVWTSDDNAEVGPYADPVTFSYDFEGGSPLASLETTGNANVTASAAKLGSAGLRLSAQSVPAYARVSTLSFGTGRRWASLAAWMRLPSGVLTANASLVRFRNTDPVATGTGGNGDIWIDQATGFVKGDLLTANSFTGSVNMGSAWFYLQAVCAYKADGTSSMKVKINGVEVGSIASTLPVTGEALAGVVLGSQSVVDQIVDIDSFELSVSDTTLDYIGTAGTPPGFYVRSGGVWVSATPYVRSAGAWTEADPYRRTGGSWQVVS